MRLFYLFAFVQLVAIIEHLTLSLTCHLFLYIYSNKVIDQCTTNSSLAQLVEHQSYELTVVGSNPTRGIYFFGHLLILLF